MSLLCLEPVRTLNCQVIGSCLPSLETPWTEKTSYQIIYFQVNKTKINSWYIPELMQWNRLWRGYYLLVKVQVVLWWIRAQQNWNQDHSFEARFRQLTQNTWLPKEISHLCAWQRQQSPRKGFQTGLSRECLKTSTKVLARFPYQTILSENKRIFETKRTGLL